MIPGVFPLHFRHFPLVFLPGAWYNKVVIPQPLHQQQRESNRPATEPESATPIPQEK
jgi:hypothetical protein